MEKEYILAIDVGTTTVKTALFNINGQLLAVEGREYPTYYPRPGWAEQDPEDWWNTTVQIVRNILARTKVNPKGILGICASSQRETMAFIDSYGRSLGRVPIWMDRRSTPQAEKIKERLSPKRIYEKTGLVVDATFTATKLLWFKENNPEFLEKAKVGLQPKDYIIFKLTGKAVTDHTVASRTMLFNINTSQWDHELISELGLEEYSHLLPESLPSWEIVGEVTPESSQTTGLAEGTPVLAGTGDRTAEILGAGILSSDKVEESTGTGSTTATLLGTPMLDPKMRYSVGVGPIPGSWALEAGMSTAGAILRWFRDQLAEGVNLLATSTRRRAYEYLDMEAEYIPPGSNGLIVLPFFSGARSPRWNPYARGVIFGLTVFHTRAHVFRAMMEGIAYEVRKILEVLREVNVKPRELVLMGGGAKSPTWARIKANVTGLEVVLPELLDAALGGDAILVSVASGALSSYDEASRVFFKEKLRITPDKSQIEIYDKYYALYEKLAEVLDAYFKEVSQLGEITPPTPSWDIERLIHLLMKLES
ncbi:MAG: xylulokinase [Infirmifilum sp.]|jgi:xylulokinase|uniref:xylulokinase n=1 Tax=Infirmifilum TaxID=2856573 RepID=UPI00069A204C|nr:FGGY-family carbohydrate kinase [Infirmifilum uzonense]